MKQLVQNGKSDNQKDYIKFQVQDIFFKIERRYKFINTVGTGAFGYVIAAQITHNDQEPNNPEIQKQLDTGLRNLKVDENEYVAIKKIIRPFESKLYAMRTLRELKIQRLLNHENILQIQEVMKPRKKDFQNIYVITELMETNLHQIIKSKQPLLDDHIKFFLYQILRGLKYVHSAMIIHRDLKPANLLVNSDCQLKICDFGQACTFIPKTINKDQPMSDYIATRWYRAPELILSKFHYTEAVDVWAVGCILAEMMIRKPLWRGSSEEEQLLLIIKLLGKPSEKCLQKIDLINNKEFLKQLESLNDKSFGQKFKNANPLAVNLLEQLLKFDPDERISVTAALEHPYLAELHSIEDEPIREEGPVSYFDFEFEKYSLKTQEYRKLIFDEISLYHSQQAYSNYLQNKRNNPDGMLQTKFNQEKLRKAWRNQMDDQ